MNKESKDLNHPMEQLVQPKVSRVNYRPIKNSDELSIYHKLLSTEFLSSGGNIRDINPDELSYFTTDGQIWAAYDDDTLVGGLTLQPYTGLIGEWWYFNNGITHKDYRGHGISERLIRSAIQNQQKDSNYFALTVTNGPFLQNGFNIVTVPELTLVDETIAQIVARKLRPDNMATICIRTGVNLS